MSGPFDPPPTAIAEIVERALSEDLTPLGDISAALLPPTASATAVFVARSDGVLAGTAAAEATFRRVDPAIEVEWVAADGDRSIPGAEFGRVHGPLSSVLTAERTALNFLGHLSGVATLTRRFVDVVAATGSASRVWDTRKTLPGLRSLEKAAVRAGGGVNHRGNLSEWVMLKDNHLTEIGITVAVQRARAQWPGKSVQVEADTMDQVSEALSVGADLILLDNMSPDDVSDAIVRRDDQCGGPTADAGAGRTLLEASGGITLDTIAAYAETGVDLISVGTITNSAPVLDIGLDIEA